MQPQECEIRICIASELSFGCAGKHHRHLSSRSFAVVAWAVKPLSLFPRQPRQRDVEALKYDARDCSRSAIDICPSTTTRASFSQKREYVISSELLRQLPTKTRPCPC